MAVKSPSIFRCPKCQQGKLFAGLLSIVDECSQCKFPLKEHEQGDGPAFFGIIIVGTLAAVFAAIVDIKYEPAYWVHVALWLPFVVIGSIISLRYGKAMLIHMQYGINNGDSDS